MEDLRKKAYNDFMLQVIEFMGNPCLTGEDLDFFRDWLIPHTEFVRDSGWIDSCSDRVS